MGNTMLTLPPNSGNFIGRIFFLGITFFLAYLFVHFGLNDPKNEHVIFRITAFHFEFKVLYIMYFLITAIGFLALTIITSLLSIYKIQIDTTTDKIIFIRFLGKKTIQSQEIAEYFKTLHRNALKEFHGLLLKLKDGDAIQVAGQNINSLSDFEDYLIKKQINCIGQKKMKFPFN
jgi:hypothetical protein